jgi:hypothetical protein
MARPGNMIQTKELSVSDDDGRDGVATDSFSPARSELDGPRGKEVIHKTSRGHE